MTTYTKITKASGTSYTKLSPPGSRYGYAKYGTATYGNSGVTYTKILKPIGVFDSYSESHRNDFEILSGGNGTDTACAQSFTGVNGVVKTSLFYLARTGTLTGNVFSKLYNITGTYGTNSAPTGSALSTSSAVAIASIPTYPNFTLIPFVFPSPFTISSGTNYAISCEFTGGNGSTTWLNVGQDFGTPSHSGNRSTFFSSWVGASSADLIFYVGDGLYSKINKAT